MFKCIVPIHRGTQNLHLYLHVNISLFSITVCIRIHTYKIEQTRHFSAGSSDLQAWSIQPPQDDNGHLRLDGNRNRCINIYADATGGGRRETSKRKTETSRREKVTLRRKTTRKREMSRRKALQIFTVVG